jgi:hypothetical protein
MVISGENLENRKKLAQSGLKTTYEMIFIFDKPTSTGYHFLLV